MNNQEESESQVLEKEYEARFRQSESYRNAVWKILCSEIFSKYIKPHHTVLDLGAGWGEFTKNIVAKKKFSMDLNPECGKRIAGLSEFIQQDCSTRWPIEAETLDVVFTSNFLEHLPEKSHVDRTLGEAHRCLKKNGIIICVGPNIQYIPGLYWGYWDHFIPITGASMAEALILKNFKIKQRIDRFLPYTMSGRKNPPLFLVKIYLKMPMLWRFFGKQFFIIAKKT